MKINIKEIGYLSNILSLFRLLLFIPILFLYLLIIDPIQFDTYLIFIIVLAFISDILDGYIARRKNQITELGKLIDPLADKILTAEIIFILFLQKLIPDFYFFLIISRDLLILIGGLIVTKRIKNILSSDYIGKITILSIGIFILVVLFKYSKEDFIYEFTLWLSTILTIVSLLNYSFRAVYVLKKHENI
jgi:CDP-diacylglycerol--glycerol-3-phosphate 3-phosphatidyltransferase